MPPRAAGQDAGSARSARATSTPAGNSPGRGARLDARTGSPAAISPASTAPPTSPRAPVTRMVIAHPPKFQISSLKPDRSMGLAHADARTALAGSPPDPAA